MVSCAPQYPMTSYLSLGHCLGVTVYIIYKYSTFTGGQGTLESSIESQDYNFPLSFLNDEI